MNTPNLKSLEEQLRARIAQQDSATVAVSLIDLASQREVHINQELVYHAASTMKVPVLLELYRRAETDPGLLDRKVPVSNTFKSIADTGHYTLDAGDDSDSSVYKLVGDSATLRFLARRMIIRSSNLATNLLIDVLGAPAIRETTERAGGHGMTVLRGVEDGPAFRAGMNNTTTSYGLARTLEAIARCTVTSRPLCDEMLSVLGDQEFNEMIPAGLPPGTRVAHKTGWITRVQHDGAIVFPPDRAPYVLVVLTKGISDTEVAARLVADLSSIVWHGLAGGPARADLTELQQKYRVAAIGQRRFTHAQYWSTVEPYLNRPIEREQIGQSGEGRPLYLLRFGHGPTKVLLWSQMHGDESTATMALADLIKYMHDGQDNRLNLWSDRLTVLMVPMLNPDGAEWFVRYNAFGIDVNRDARTLSTPEGRALKAVRDRFHPDFGFNLHDQNARTRVGETGNLAAIALLAPPTDSSGVDNLVSTRAKHVAALVRDAIEPLVGGHVTKYDDAYNPRAFGDHMQRWGTSTVLIESGGWHGDPEKQYLRMVNFVALAAALDAVATGDYLKSNLARYESLLTNGPTANDLLVRGGTIVVPGLEPFQADIAIDGMEGGVGRIVAIGDLTLVTARDTLDASGLFLHPNASALRRGPTNERMRFMPGGTASLTIKRGSDPASEVVYAIEGTNVKKLTASATK